MPHAPPGRRGLPGDESHDRLPEVRLDPVGRVFLVGAANFTDHHHGIRLRVGGKQRERVDMRRPDQGIAADADARALAHAEPGELMDGFVGERAAPRHDTNPPFLADVAGNDASFGLSGRDHAGTIRADEPRLRVFLEKRHGAHHVERRNAFRDADDERETSVGRFHNRIGGKGGWHEDDRRIRAGLFHGVLNGIEDREALDGRPTFSRLHTAHDSRVVRGRLPGVKGPFLTHTLNDQARRFINKNGHVFLSNDGSSRSHEERRSREASKVQRLLRLASYAFVPS